MRMRRLLGVCPVLALVAVAGCNASSSGSINVTSTGTTNATWTSGNSYVLAEGEAGALAAAPLDESGKPASITVYAAADDPTIAAVYTTTNPNSFVVVGAKAGTTNVRFSGGGDPPQVVAVNVVAQGAQ